jgi:hypothetical protein
MAYMSQERKKELAPKIKEILKGYGLKGSLSVRHHSTLVLNISQGGIDFIAEHINGAEITNGYIQVNPFYKNHFNGIAQKAIGRLIDAMNIGNHDNSNSQIDYFDVGWYIDINIGSWDKPYKLI